MMMNQLRSALVIGTFAWSAIATAGEMSKEECVDAHSRGQDARDQGKLSLARKLFLTCAQPGCPSLVQGDCARFADDLNHQQPTLTFAARDTAGNDLPDTTVYIDDVLVVTRLDDGKPHDADPGKHIVKFINGGREQAVTIVLNSGEKGRTVVGTFPAIGGVAEASRPTASGAVSTTEKPRQTTTKTVHPTGAKVAMVLGSLATAGGAALGIVGLTRLPSNCSFATHDCIGPPGDPSLARAQSAVQLSDIGWAVGGVGVAALLGGTVWYFTGAKKEHESIAAIPWFDAGGAGIALAGSFR